LTSSAIEKALRIARLAHEGQTDKGGNPYIQHPLAVADMCDTENEKIVAILHDVIEDAPDFYEQINEACFNNEIMNALSVITKNKRQSYQGYLKNLKANPIALKVKIADITHNMDLKRLERTPTEKDLQRQKKYIKARKYLLM
jgi:(p)ppGpp synthase/HD superfamily hydrolase